MFQGIQEELAGISLEKGNLKKTWEGIIIRTIAANDSPTSALGNSLT
jgi:hypothetical protein